MTKTTNSIKRWMMIQSFAIAGLVAGGVLLGVWISSESAKREAIQRAADQAEVTVCKRTVLNAPPTLRILGAVSISFENSITTTKAALAAQDADDPLIKVRKASLKRSKHALGDVSSFMRQVRKNTPTRTSCNELAVKKNVGLPFPNVKEEKDAE